MTTCFSIASWSFHGLLEAGQQDMFRYISDCKDLGCGLLDPWNGHLQPLIAEDQAIKSSANPRQTTFSQAGLDYVTRVKAAGEAAGLPFGCLAVDGAHMYEPTSEARQANRAAAYRWLDVAKQLGAAQVRMDSGGSADMPDAMFEIIVDGFRDVVRHAHDLDIELVMENHWGASHVPVNIVKILDAVEGLGLLFDSNNFAPGTQERGWTLCVPYARAVHIKTFEFDAHGNDPSVDLPRVIRMLVDSGYNGCWGIESCPRDGDEYGAARKTMDLISRVLAA